MEDDMLRKRYGSLLSRFDRYYEQLEPLAVSRNHVLETFWYNIREFSFDHGKWGKSAWSKVAWGLILGHFFVPLLWLLWYKNKFGKRLIAIAVFALVFHLLDLYWNILPQRFVDHHSPLHYSVRPFDIVFWDISAWIGMGGICIWAFLKSLTQAAPIPLKDPRIQESLNLHE